MKKILVTFALVSSLVFSLAACAMANSVYLDGAVGSTWKTEISGANTDDDLTGYTLGGDYSFDKFSVGLEYTTGTQNNFLGGSDKDYNTVQLKGGYDFLSSDQGKLAATLSYYVRNYDKCNNMKIDAILLGLDGSYQINAKNLLQGSLGYSVSGQWKIDGLSDEDATTMLANLKYTYLFTDKFGASIGYRYADSKIDTTGDPKFKQYGPTVGVTYKF